jgi:regulator of replication initiation timing
MTHDPSLSQSRGHARADELALVDRLVRLRHAIAGMAHELGSLRREHAMVKRENEALRREVDELRRAAPAQ